MKIVIENVRKGPTRFFDEEIYPIDSISILVSIEKSEEEASIEETINNKFDKNGVKTALFNISPQELLEEIPQQELLSLKEYLKSYRNLNKVFLRKHSCNIDIFVTVMTMQRLISQCWPDPDKNKKVILNLYKNKLNLNLAYTNKKTPLSILFLSNLLTHSCINQQEKEALLNKCINFLNENDLQTFESLLSENIPSYTPSATQYIIIGSALAIFYAFATLSPSIVLWSLNFRMIDSHEIFAYFAVTVPIAIISLLSLFEEHKSYVLQKNSPFVFSKQTFFDVFKALKDYNLSGQTQPPEEYVRGYPERVISPASP